MKSVVELDIAAPRTKVASLFSDPRYSTAWMDDIARWEPVSGEPGTTGSQYRLVPKEGDMIFVATIVSKTLPNELRLHLDGSDVAVSIRVTFDILSANRTRLTSEEIFHFKGPIRKVVGLFARPAIKKAHRHHMEAFQRFAEDHRPEQP